MRKNYLKDLERKSKNQAGSTVTVYSLNKQIYQQMPALNEDKIKSEAVKIGLWFSKEPNFKYFMFLNNELHDYTIFNFNTTNLLKAQEELIELMKSRGEVVSIEYQHEQDAYEIWIKKNNEAYMYMLFDCNDFVIEI